MKIDSPTELPVVWISTHRCSIKENISFQKAAPRQEGLEITLQTQRKLSWNSYSSWERIQWWKANLIFVQFGSLGSVLICSTKCMKKNSYMEVLTGLCFSNRLHVCFNLSSNLGVASVPISTSIKVQRKYMHSNVGIIAASTQINGSTQLPLQM